MTHDCEIIFPSHEEVNEPWALQVLAASRFEWRYYRGLKRTEDGASLRVLDENGHCREQWAYKCVVEGAL